MADSTLCATINRGNLLPVSHRNIVTKSRTFADAAGSYVEHGGEAKYLPPILQLLGDRDLLDIYPFDIRQAVLELYPKQANSTRNRQGITRDGGTLRGLPAALLQPAADVASLYRLTGLIAMKAIKACFICLKLCEKCFAFGQGQGVARPHFEDATVNLGHRGSLVFCLPETAGLRHLRHNQELIRLECRHRSGKFRDIRNCILTIIASIIDDRRDLSVRLISLHFGPHRPNVLTANAVVKRLATKIR